jgi:hypothetical protein
LLARSLGPSGTTHVIFVVFPSKQTPSHAARGDFGSTTSFARGPAGAGALRRLGRVVDANVARVYQHQQLHARRRRLSRSVNFSQ